MQEIDSQSADRNGSRDCVQRPVQKVCVKLGCAGEQGSEYTCNTMIKVASYAGDFERALAVLDDMETAGVAPTAAIWGSLLVACGKVGPSSTFARMRG